MNLHLQEISSQVPPGAHAVLILDRAGWPELNPTENIWQFLRQNQLSNRVHASYQSIVDASCDAWNWLTGQPGLIASITTRQWAKPGTA